MTIDHRDTAVRAFAASQLPDPPRTGAQAFAYLERVLAMLPPEEKAGYVKAPANGENVIALPRDGTTVRTARVMYPDGQIYKVMNDVPNGNPQWEREDVRPELYVPFTGAFLPPGPTDPPVVDPPAGGVLVPTADVVRALTLLEDLSVRVTQMQTTLNEIQAQPAPSMPQVIFPTYTGRLFGVTITLTPGWR